MTAALITQVWPDWEVERLLGKGSFGTVYQAVRRGSQFVSRAAIKVISIPSDPAELASLRAEGMSEADTRVYFQGIVEDFTQEIRVMDAFKGVQNIVSVEDYQVLERKDSVGWDILIRMELLTPFTTYYQTRKLTRNDVIRLGVDICTALELCAQRNIVHRDIKPENIFVNHFGNFKLGDFGIARKLENATCGMSQKGTYNYMAPEVATGTHYDARVDLYSLGLVLYRLLNEYRMPFVENDQQKLNANARKLAVDRRLRGEPLKMPCNADPGLGAVVLRACAYRPEQRFQTPEQMKAALLHLLTQPVQPVQRPVQPVQPAQRPAQPVSSTPKPSEQDPNATVAVRGAAPAVRSRPTVPAKKPAARYVPVKPMAPDNTEVIQDAPAMCGICIAFCWVPLLGTILSLIARHLARWENVRGKGLALTGFILNQLFMIGIIQKSPSLGIILLIVSVALYVAVVIRGKRD